MDAHPARTTTVADALGRAVSLLTAVSEFADSDARELLSRLLGTGRGQLSALRRSTLDAKQLATFDTWLVRRLAGEPVQYITGRAAFRELDLEVTPAVLIPRSETEGLVEAVLEIGRTAPWMQPRVLDLGTGSGAIALSIAREWPAAALVATDSSDDALAVAARNAMAHRLEGRVEFRRGDWYDAIASDERFEVIVSNPPYVAEDEADLLPRDVRDYEPAAALFSGAGGLEATREIIEDAPRHLIAGGLLALELAESRAREVAGWLEGAHDWSGVELRDDLAGRPRVLLARRERGPAIAPAQWGEER